MEAESCTDSSGADPSRVHALRLNDEARQYMVKELEEVGMDLGHLLLEEQDFTQGDFFTFLPAYVDRATAIRELDGIIDFRTEYRPVIDPVAQYFAACMQKMPFPLLVAEDTCETIDDEDDVARISGHYGTDWFCCGRTVYQYTTRACPMIVEETMCKVAAACVETVFVARMPEPIAWDQEAHLALDDLRAIARLTEHVSVCAYDDEGHLVWSRNGALCPLE